MGAKIRKFEKLASNFTALDLFLWLDNIPRKIRKITYFRTQRHKTDTLHKIAFADLNKIIPGINTCQAMLSLGNSKISEDVYGYTGIKQLLLTSKKSTFSEIVSVVDDPTNTNTAFEKITTLNELWFLLARLGHTRIAQMSVCGINLDLDNKNFLFMNSDVLMFNVTYCGLEAAIDVSKQLGWK